MGTSACPRSSVEVGTDDVPLNEGGKSVPPFYEASHVRGRWRAPLLAEPDQTPHITMWHYGYGRLLRCGCAGSMRREGYGGCAGAVVLGYGRSAPLNTAVECSSSPQHRGSKATCRPPSPGALKKTGCSHLGRPDIRPFGRGRGWGKVSRPPFSFITRVAPHCVNTLRILHAAHED